MADTKISALPAATTPLAGTEVLPIVQSGITKKVAVDDLTVKNIRSNATSGILQVTGPGAGTTRVATVPDANWTAARTDTAQSFTGNQTLSTGSLIIGTSGQGIDFSATPGTGTSELLADYEEGTWTPVLSSASGSFTTVTLGADTSAYYTKIGREVTFQMWFTTDAITVGTASGDVYISLPFTAATLAGAGDHSAGSVGLCVNFTTNHPDGIIVRGGDNKMNLVFRATSNGATSNLQVGSLATGAGSNIIVISGLYIAA
jgi:hypothetical protein